MQRDSLPPPHPRASAPDLLGVGVCAPPAAGLSCREGASTRLPPFGFPREMSNTSRSRLAIRMPWDVSNNMCLKSCHGLTALTLPPQQGKPPVVSKSQPSALSQVKLRPSRWHPQNGTAFPIWAGQEGGLAERGSCCATAPSGMCIHCPGSTHQHSRKIHPISVLVLLVAIPSPGIIPSPSPIPGHAAHVLCVDQRGQNLRALCSPAGAARAPRHPYHRACVRSHPGAAAGTCFPFLALPSPREGGHTL